MVRQLLSYCLELQTHKSVFCCDAGLRQLCISLISCPGMGWALPVGHWRGLEGKREKTGLPAAPVCTEVATCLLRHGNCPSPHFI